MLVSQDAEVALRDKLYFFAAKGMDAGGFYICQNFGSLKTFTVLAPRVA